MHVICVFGSGNALNPGNHIYHARLNEAYEAAGITLAIFGRHQPSMTDTTHSEAQTGIAYLERKHAENNRGMFKNYVAYAIHDGPEIKSISASCAAIVKRYLINQPEMHVDLIMSWPNIWRAYYLLKKQAKRSRLNWGEVRHRIHLVPCGGTFVPYLREKGFKAIPWWLYNVAARECGAWLKSLLDPYDQHINQKRTAPGA